MKPGPTARRCAPRGRALVGLVLLAAVLAFVPAGTQAGSAAKAETIPVKPGVPAVSGPPPHVPEMRLHFINVGQGAATLIEFPCGAMLVDTGGELDTAFDSNVALSAYLDAFFARRTDLGRTIDLLVFTHPHIDHVRGASTVLTGYTVKNIVDDGVEAVQDDAVVAVGFVHEFVEAHADVHHQTVSIADFAPDGSGLTSSVIDPFPECKGANPVVQALWGGVPSDPGWGQDDYGNDRFANANNHSVATRIDLGESSFLITGDLEIPSIAAMLEARRAELVDVDVYEVGHHGSANGTTGALMSAMTPDWAVMEVGPFDRKSSWTAWAYGFPRDPLIALLEAGVIGDRTAVAEEIGTAMKTFISEDIGKAIYATGWDGALVLDARADGGISLGAPDLVQPAHP